MPKERWKPIKDWEGFYEVSNLGRVRSVSRVVERLGRNGFPSTLTVTGRILNPGVHKKTGYRVVNLSGDSIKRQEYVHRLVAFAFLKEPEPHQNVVMHKDDDPSNNVRSNLRWGTDGDNVQDKIDKGRQLHGSQIAQSTLTEREVRRIVKAGFHATDTDIGRKYGVSPTAIRNIRTGVTWARVTGIGGNRVSA